MLSPEGEVRSAIVNGISRSLLPLIFNRLGKDNKPLEREFDIDLLPSAATVICKFSGLLIQAYWFHLKSISDVRGGPPDLHIPPKLDNIILQLWGGHQKYTEGFAMSILHTASVAPESSLISRLVNNPEIIVRWTRLISSRKEQYKKFQREIESEDWHSLFVHLLQALPVLKEVEYKDGKLILTNLADKPIPVPEFPFLYRVDERNPAYYLYDFEHVQFPPDIVFKDPFTGHTIECDLANNQEYKEKYDAIREILGLGEVRESIVYLFGGGYEHIRRLAEAITEVEPNSPREKKLNQLKNKYREKYGDVHDGIDADRYPTDFITLLLADKGPVKIAHEILEQNTDLLDDYLAFFERHGQGKASMWLNKMNEQLENRKDRIKEYLQLDSVYKDKFEKAINIDVHAWCLTAAAGLQTDEPPSYVESINIRINMIERWHQRYYGDKKINELMSNINWMVERTLKFLTVFYYGLEGYYESMCAEPKKEDGDYYDRHEKRMLEFARARWEKKDDRGKGLNEYSVGRLVGAFRDAIAHLEGKECVKRVLGKDKIVDLRKYKNELATDEWVKFFNRFKHPENLPPIRHEEIPRFVEQTKRLFNFLRYGYLAATYPPYSTQPIYPMVISFRELHRNRDGMLVYSYEISSIDENEIADADENKTRISILTPREYMPNEEYYCLPHGTRSIDKWWLEPFLVRCSTFDSIMKQ